jgi:UDP-arabinose 4-epimerase
MTSVKSEYNEANPQKELIFIYSSTCAVYGTPLVVPVSESSQTIPLSSYGKAKLYSEQIVYETVRANPFLKGGVLRYFNVVGADPKGRVGEIPKAKDRAYERISTACFEAMTGKRNSLSILGTDFPTPDGTAIRDYIHVSDLVEGHISLMSKLREKWKPVSNNSPPLTISPGISLGGRFGLYILGTGKGTSVQEFTRACLSLKQKDPKAEVYLPKIVNLPRREGDSAIIYADPSLAKRDLNWKAEFTDFKRSLETSWSFRLAHHNGFDEIE